MANKRLAGYSASFVPEHWSTACQATIPAAWDIINPAGFTVASGDTEEEAWALAEADL